MKRTEIARIFADMDQYGGQDVTVCGWARTIRDMKNFGFIELNDGSCFKNLQIVFEPKPPWTTTRRSPSRTWARPSSSTGKVVLTPQAKQPLELKADSRSPWRAPPPDYPLQKKRHSVEFLRTIQHLRPRTNLFSAAFRVRSRGGLRHPRVLPGPGLCLCPHPHHHRLATARAPARCSSVTTLDLAERPADRGRRRSTTARTSSASPPASPCPASCNAENFAMAFGNVYTFGPTFRAENSNTQRHAAEFWMIEPEMAFCRPERRHGHRRGHDQVRHPLSSWSSCPDEMDFFNSFVDKGLKERLEHVASSDFGRVTYTEAVEHPEEGATTSSTIPVEWGMRPPDRARALPHRADLQEARVRHRLPQGDQGVLHAPQRRRQDRRRRRLPGPRHRRDHRRQPA